MNKMNLIIALATGGTGGHISPATAIYNGLKKEGINSTFCTDYRGLNLIDHNDYKIIKSEYGILPNFNNLNFNDDVIFNFNGTTAGVRVPNLEWIPIKRSGVTICDATSAAFAMELDWTKLDVTTFSWQKCLGGEGGHGVFNTISKCCK